MIARSVPDRSVPTHFPHTEVDHQRWSSWRAGPRSRRTAAALGYTSRVTDSLDGFVPAHLRDDRYDEAPPWPADEVAPGLWQSGHPSPGENWDAVFDLSGEEDPLDDVEFYVHWLIEDGPAPDRDTLVALADLVRSMRASGKRVLVHCAAGMNRSGLLSAASLIREGWSADDAMEAVRTARHGALNNPEFVDLLRRL